MLHHCNRPNYVNFLNLKWFEQWELKCPDDKCAIKHICDNNNKLQLHLGNKNINQVNSFKELWINSDSNLVFATQINHSASKACNKGNVIYEFLIFI
jgi:hypothetical protein